MTNIDVDFPFTLYYNYSFIYFCLAKEHRATF